MLLLLYAGRRLVTAVELCLKAHQERLAEREQRASIVAAANVLLAGGAVVQFDQGRPDWLLVKPPTPCLSLPAGDREAA
ncbi:hypothetical protein ABZ622_38725 [Streptomyces sp. NPDC007164]|uniref:hypothetical protein n=1 Tax=Streptomyces sp. NPDC007164 TaxID=3156918 RepID=UPI0033EE499B